jgi:hypothetical protein
MTDTRAPATSERQSKAEPNAVVERAKAPKFLSVEECRASLPIKISRRMVVNYIRAAGPDEHRRQLFLTPQQWAAVAAGIKPCHSRSSGARKKGIFQIVGTVAGCRVRESTGLDSERAGAKGARTHACGAYADFGCDNARACPRFQSLSRYWVCAPNEVIVGLRCCL